MSILTQVWSLNAASFMKQMKRGQTAPYWSNPLVNLCRILSNLRQDAWSNEEVEEEVRLMEESLQLQQEVHNTQKLQHLCGVLQGRGERVSLPPATVCVKWFIFNSFKANVSTKVNIFNPDASTSLPQTFDAPCCSKTRTSPPLPRSPDFCLFTPPSDTTQHPLLCLPRSKYSRNLWSIWRRPPAAR